MRVTISLSLPLELLERIDAIRGDVSRSRFVAIQTPANRAFARGVFILASSRVPYTGMPSVASNMKNDRYEDKNPITPYPSGVRTLARYTEAATVKPFPAILPVRTDI